MIRANQPPRVAGGFHADQRAAMAADIVHRVNDAFIVTHDNNWIAVHFDREKIAWLGNLARMTGKEPAATPDSLHVGLINFDVAVEIAGKGPATLAAGDERLDPGLHDAWASLAGQR